MMILFALSSCKDDIKDFVPNQPNTPNLGKIVNTDIGGVVIDEAGLPLQNVEISIENQTVSTDENGIFLIRNISVNSRQAYLKADKSGYFHGSRMMLVEEDKTHYATIQLLQKEVVGSFDSSTGDLIEFDGVKLDFPANGIKLKSGGAYSGTVNVEAKFLDPSDPAVHQKMPGDLRGFNAANGEVVLTTYGMVVVELTGNGGEPLQVGDDSEVGMSTPVPNSHMSTAPATIPLWHFDEENGFWQEEGLATLNGDRYESTVSHFSWWNNDYPYNVGDLISVKGQIVDEDGNPVPGVHVNIRRVGDPYGGHGNTDNNGEFCGGAPMGVELELTIVDISNFSGCGWAELFIQNLGILTDDVDLGAIVFIPNPLGGNTPKQINVKGKLIDCDGNPVTNGYVRGVAGKQFFSVFVDDTDGSFEYLFTTCDATANIELRGVDLNNQLQTEELTYSTDNDIDLGDITACDQLEYYITYTLDGDDYFIPDPRGGPEGGNTYVSASLDSLTSIFFAINTDSGTGTYEFATFGSDPQSPSSFSVNQFFRNPNTIVEVIITKYDTARGGTLVASFNGTFDDLDGGSHTISGNVRTELNW